MLSMGGGNEGERAEGRRGVGGWMRREGGEVRMNNGEGWMTEEERAVG